MASIKEAKKIANKLAKEFLDDVLTLSSKDFIRKHMMQEVDMEITSFDNLINVRSIRIPLMRTDYNAWFISATKEIYVVDISFHISASAPINDATVDEIMDFLNEKVIPKYFKMVSDNIDDEEDE